MPRNNSGVKRGTLIAIEGIDGSGKSTQHALIAASLRQAGHDPLVTREPTDGPMGRRIRQMARSGERIEASEELRWFTEDRREHVAQEIGPALEAGRIVITDRYTLSSVAYQGARGLDPDDILRASEAEFPVPDLVILVEIDPELGLERVRARGGVSEPSFEDRSFLERVAALFAGLEGANLERVDGSLAAEEVHREILALLESRLGLSLGIGGAA
jgi:dTMP kinase